MMLSGEYKFQIKESNDYITAGLNMFSDYAGTVVLTNTQMHPAINYHKSLSNERPMYLALGITGGLIRKSISLNRVTTDNQWVGGFDPSRPLGEEALVPSYFALDAGVGLSYNSNFGNKEKNMFFIGAAMHHLTKPRNSFYAANSSTLAQKFVSSIGIRFGVDDFTSFVVQADHISQGGSQEIIGGAIYSYGLGDDPDNVEYTLHGGVFLRWKDAIVPLIKMQRKQFSVGLSYDVNISPLRATSRGRGGFELSLSYIGFVKKLSSSELKVICPKF
jgi:type IX secretion system PorP/SprF family membrane protein